MKVWTAKHEEWTSKHLRVCPATTATSALLHARARTHTHTHTHIHTQCHDENQCFTCWPEDGREGGGCNPVYQYKRLVVGEHGKVKVRMPPYYIGVFV